METVVIIIMLAVALTFLLKLSYHSLWECLGISAVAALFTLLSVDFAVSQSKTQIADWLQNPELMLDTSVLLTLDVMLQLAFCFLSTRRLTGERLSRRLEVAWQISFWVPGIMIFPVLFSTLVEIIFSMTGADFGTLGWITAVGVLIGAPLLSLGLKYLLPEKDLRLELMFLINLLTAALGIVATVNGRTASAGVSQVEWQALAAVILLLVFGAFAGLLYFKFKTKRTYR